MTYMLTTPYRLQCCNEDCRDLFQYMYEQFHDEMKDEYQRVKYFEIRYLPYSATARFDEVTMTYTDSIQSVVLQWIRKERDSGRLFDKTHWRCYIDIEDYNRYYIGYRFLFPYLEFYFQLTMDFFYNFTAIPDEDGNQLHFQLALYGWKEDGKDYVQPDNEYILSEELIIPNYEKDTHPLE